MSVSALRIAALLLLALLPLAPAAGQQIDLSLNLLFNDPTDASMGGAWEVVAKADGGDNQGINYLVFSLTGIDAGVVNELPRGKVNGSGSVNAGFQVFVSADFTQGDVTATQIVASQSQIDPVPGDEAGAFYGVGNFANGSPNYPEAPGGSMSVGDPFTTLLDVEGVAWATGDVLGDANWGVAAKVASGTFSTAIPSFFELELQPTVGSVYTTLGTSTEVGDSSDFESTAITSIVRTNFLPDYNNDGVIDAADYTVWRDTLGVEVSPFSGADGDGSGVIDIADYEVWRDNFGATIPSAVGVLSTPTPEPHAGLMGAVLVASLAASRRQKQGVLLPRLVFRKKREYGKKLLDTPETPSHNAAS